MKNRAAEGSGKRVGLCSTSRCEASLVSRRHVFVWQENSTSDLITNLTPGAQYRVVVYHTNGPLISPPSEPVIIDIGEQQCTLFIVCSNHSNCAVMR